ncbi:hypothetical protein [Aureimonas sp. AU20]|uniref:hypothetical protein n=1 Tax=Aureimonas sp. AU20 TaxID=1349819 RepID=UPI0007223F16|nr:hypothetical protein [Aureimonas sp. AU20]ALN73559.1 hypothetical protein M673_12595 [Aureimonas sp. AU20]
MARNEAHDPGPFFTVADEDIRGEYGNQRDDHGRFFCGLMYGLSITAGVMFLAYFMWVGMGIAKVDALRHQEAFSGYRTASTEQGR